MATKSANMTFINRDSVPKSAIDEAKAFITSMKDVDLQFIKDEAANVQRYMDLFLAKKIAQEDLRILLTGVKRRIRMRALNEKARLRTKVIGIAEQLLTVLFKKLIASLGQ